MQIDPKDVLYYQILDSDNNVLDPRVLDHPDEVWRAVRKTVLTTWPLHERGRIIGLVRTDDGTAYKEVPVTLFYFEREGNPDSMRVRITSAFFPWMHEVVS